MKDKVEIKRLSDKLDALKHQQPSVIQEGDQLKINELINEIDTLTQEITRLRSTVVAVLSKQAQQLQALPFSRVITKKEQADMGALKRAAPGIKVVHPMTALGREMGIQEVTGFAKKAF